MRKPVAAAVTVALTLAVGATASPPTPKGILIVRGYDGVSKTRPPPPKGILIVRGYDGVSNTTPPLSKVWIGQRVAVEFKGPISAQVGMNYDGLFCTLKRSGNACRRYGPAALTYVDTRIATSVVVRGKVTFSAYYVNPETKQRAVVTTKVLKVVPRKR